MPKFKSLKELEKFVQKKTEKAIKSEAVSSVFKFTMAKNVETEVYDYYPEPYSYKRRGEDGGLSDEDNMVFTEHITDGKNLVSLFENLTVGNEKDPILNHGEDSMKGYFISHLIENGSNNIHTTPKNTEDGWYSLGKWSDPRPFAKATANELNTTGSTMNQVLKDTLEHHINK